MTDSLRWSERAHGKIILFGEHAVLYGRPGLVAAIERGVSVSVAPGTGRLSVSTPGRDSSDGDHGRIATAFDEILRVAGVARSALHWDFHVEFELPPGTGLGSSAAFSTALARAVLRAATGSRDPQSIAASANAAEAVFHGQASGIDQAIAQHGGLALYTTADGLRRFPASSAPALRLCVGFTGHTRSSRSMIARVRSQLEREPQRVLASFDRIATCVADGARAITDGDLAALGGAMTRNHQELDWLGVSSVEIEALREIALEHGALGAKLTGAGGGGCVIAVAPDLERVREAWARAGLHAFITTLDRSSDASVDEPGSSQRARGDRASSRIPGFYELTLSERRNELVQRGKLDEGDAALLDRGSLSFEIADQMVENVVGLYALPIGLGLNFRVDGKDHLVPMCVEEPSVVAAASNAAKLVRAGGGFFTETDPPVMIGQLQVLDVADTGAAERRLDEHRERLLRRADEILASLVRRGGGARGLEARVLAPSRPGAPGMVVVHLHVDCRDAMGANMVNTLAESLAGDVASILGGRPGLRILSNLADRRMVRARCSIPARALDTTRWQGEEVRDGIVRASQFAELDPYRAATHNKGVMNGIDAVTIATGNDWRAVEAGAHAYAARRNRYEPLAIWRVGRDGSLDGSLAMPMAVGTVGGTSRVHPGARLAVKILGVTSAQELAGVIASVGLASNLAALRALACEGIQRGHMSLHNRSQVMAAE
ncbi:hydroxymethylglutaryl-CoA reductase, degradative [Sandaracinus amylolyticus]|uniref:hydroxymethylglutaryl-CoA reductase, degradative n=1 Tax=Sandaracinus amylolyticus TaxID=927083 RepID=UPI001F2F9886|nr:hydroxymethylglutaryl-CoA reductase, degradative [Sandaracinus amylolyticus]UJR84165.1 Hypothetical protein I5071_62360 [Sandaracinus amylolyticus]